LLARTSSWTIDGTLLTEGVGGDPEKLQFTRDQMAATVREAGDVPVEAHAFGDEGVRLAVESGVRSVEHGSLHVRGNTRSDETARYVLGADNCGDFRNRREADTPRV
jgi:imidazolonepropionase-like amidohydrolase